MTTEHKEEAMASVVDALEMYCDALEKEARLTRVEPEGESK